MKEIDWLTVIVSIIASTITVTLVMKGMLYNYFRNMEAIDEKFRDELTDNIVNIVKGYLRNI